MISRCETLLAIHSCCSCLRRGCVTVSCCRVLVTPANNSGLLIRLAALPRAVGSVFKRLNKLVEFLSDVNDEDFAEHSLNWRGWWNYSPVVYSSCIDATSVPSLWEVVISQL